MLVLDSSGIVAVAFKGDASHVKAQRIVSAYKRPFVVPTGILSEVTFMLDQRIGLSATQALLKDLQFGRLTMDCGEQDCERIAQLVYRYADLPLGCADSAVIACAERRRAPVLTFDERQYPIAAREGTFRIAGLDQ